MKLLFTLTLFLICQCTSAQVFETVVNTNISSGQWNRFAMISSNDNGYILFATQNYYGSEKWIFKIDSVGNVVWGKKNYSGFYAASPIGKDHFAAYYAYEIWGWPDTIYMEMVIFDSTGNPVSEVAIPESLEVNCMHPTSDGGTIAAGKHISNGPPVIFKTDSMGNFDLMKTLDSIPDLNLSDLIEARAGGYIGVGDCGYMDTIYHYRQMIFRLNNYGDTVWTRTFFIFGNLEAWKIYNSVNNGFLIVGRGYNAQGNIPYILQLDSSGDILWVKGISSSSATNMMISDFVMTTDSNFIFSGYTNDGGYSYPCLLKTDSSGNFLWMRKYPAAGYYEFGVLNSGDGGFALAASNANGQIVLIRTDSTGASSCDSLCALPLSAAPPLQNIPTSQYIYVSSYVNIPYSIPPGASYLDSIPIQMDMCLVAEDKDISSDNYSFKIFPNPAMNQFAVTSKQLTKGQLEIFNFLGEKIYSTEYRGQTTVECRLFPKGIYFVRVSNSESILTKKLLIE